MVCISGQFFPKKRLLFLPKIPYDLVAKRSEANLKTLQFPLWWTYGESNPDFPDVPKGFGGP
ncbi:hypothetical protein A2108_02050 [Candidatus Wolfebacteria bacterium GWA1_42_9]|uniref:Uncharacterized protein n=1 Tax=Candidatus Wolfebacteria bacterium GWA1_42_9 TaxID=1802553 RepID=A0A1F8DNE4_9BACT|nr:MAG: hypothetical protein A2108_02050 [Candidatus Wolfebacteria bacterium GWA1_42_9]